MKRVKKELLGQFGDVNWQDYGGALVIKHTDRGMDESWIHCHMIVKLPSDEYECPEYEVFEFEVPQLKVNDEGKVVNKYEHQEWFSERHDLDLVAKCYGVDTEDLIKMLCSDNCVVRAEAYVMVGDYFGFENLDQYPEYPSKRDLYNKYRVAY